MLGKVGSLVARVAEEAGSVVGLRFGTEEPRYTSENFPACAASPKGTKELISIRWEN